jgi:two-component system response regulator BaeR
MTESPVKILIVEDEVELAEILRDYLASEGFSVEITHTGQGVVDRVREDPPNLMLLDLMLPVQDGISICRDVRQFSNLPIIIVTAKVSEVDRVIGLDIGADDYICKPAKPKEIVARVKAVLRRSILTQGKSGLNCLLMDENTNQATLLSAYFELTPVEYCLLEVLNDNAHRICPRDLLIVAIRLKDEEITNYILDSHIQSLSRKLSIASSIANPIRSVYSLGFVLELDSKPSDAFPSSVEGSGTG